MDTSTHGESSSVGPPPHHAAGVGLVIVMALGSVVVWLVSPIVWLWIGSQMTDSTQPSLGPYLLVLVGMVLTAVVIGKLLGMINRTHMRITGRAPDTRKPAKWNRSMRGERAPVNDRGVLEQVMAISVSFALVLFAIWFFIFAGSSLPGG
jgi:hypothetical protein